MEYEVTDDIPPPANTSGKYPFKNMTIGSGFNVNTKVERDKAQSAAINYTKTAHGKGKKFSSAKHEGGYRLWRVM